MRREVKDLIREKKLAVWNKVVERVNVDFEGSKKEFWAILYGGKPKVRNRILLP